MTSLSGIPYLTARNEPHSPATCPDHIFVEGDNLPGTRALMPEAEGSVGFVFIDQNMKNQWEGMAVVDALEDAVKAAHQLLHRTGHLAVYAPMIYGGPVQMLVAKYFGHENIQMIHSWQCSPAGGNVIDHANIIVARRTPMASTKGVFPRDYKYEDPDGRRYNRESLVRANNKENQYSSGPLFDADGNAHHPKLAKGEAGQFGAGWRTNKLALDRMLFENGTVYEKVYEDEQELVPLHSLLKSKMVGTHATGKEDLKRVVDTGFGSAKPVALMKALMKSYAPAGRPVLDLFGGSGSLAHAAAELNAEEDARYRTITIDLDTSLAQTRLGRVLTGERWADGEEHPSLNQSMAVFDVAHTPLEDVVTTGHDETGRPVRSHQEVPVEVTLDILNQHRVHAYVATGAHVTAAGPCTVLTKGSRCYVLADDPRDVTESAVRTGISDETTQVVYDSPVATMPRALEALPLPARRRSYAEAVYALG